MNSQPKSIFLSCDCKCSVLELEKDEEFNQFNLSIWKSHGGGVLSWKERFRWMKHILLTGQPWADNTILNQESAIKLRDFINDNLGAQTKDKSLDKQFDLVVSCLLIKNKSIFVSQEKQGWFNGYTTSISMVSQAKEDPRAYIPDLIDQIYKETQLNKTTILDEFRFEHLVTLENIGNIKKHNIFACWIRPGEELDSDKTKREDWELIELEKVNNIFGLLQGLNEAVELLK